MMKDKMIKNQRLMTQHFGKMQRKERAAVQSEGAELFS